MIYSKHRFSLEIQSAHSQIAIPVMLGDTGSVFYIALTEGGHSFAIPEGTLAMLTIHRPTGTHLQAFCTIKNNTTIIYDFMQNENTAAVEGVHTCALTLYGGQTGSVISTSWFTMTVSARVVNHDDINITDENSNAIDAMIAAEASRQANEESRINSEASRAAAEEARENAEAERESASSGAVKDAQEAVSGILAAETSRVAAEKARVNAEASRVTAEKARVSAETEREAACAQAVKNAADMTTLLQTYLKNGAFTPVKGRDYFTPEDVEEIVERCVSQLLEEIAYDGTVEVI